MARPHRPGRSGAPRGRVRAARPPPRVPPASPSALSFARGVFVDSGAWYAVQVPDDQHHPLAAETWRWLLEAGAALATSNLVLGETFTLLRVTHGFEEAWRFVDRARTSDRLRILSLDEESENEAYSILSRYRDQDFSFVDATSFALCRREGILHAFAFDRHFATAGLLRIGVDTPPLRR